MTPGRAPAAGRGHVVVVGSVNVDFVLRVGRLPRPGETVTGGEFTRHHGGKGANQAVATARMGAHVAFVGAVGHDELGSSAAVELDGEGIDTSGIARLPDVPTGVALIVVDAGGENQIAVASGANGSLGAAAVESALDGLAMAEDAVFLANLEISDEALMSGARFARRRGWRIVVNPAPARSLPAELLAMGPLLLPNAGEAERLTGLTDPASSARALGDRTGAPVAVTLGSKGALLVEGHELTRLPAPRVDAVDATGAGDTFAGAFAAELAAGADVRQAAQVAVLAASLSVGHAGARGGMPTHQQVLESLGA